MDEVKPENDSGLLYKKVKTKPIRVKVTLSDGSRVEGFFHQPPNIRLTDLMNRHTRDNPFLPVTDAHVYLHNGEHLSYKFLTVNRAMIICCFPVAEEVIM